MEPDKQAARLCLFPDACLSVRPVRERSHSIKKTYFINSLNLISEVIQHAYLETFIKKWLGPVQRWTNGDWNSLYFIWVQTSCPASVLNYSSGTVHPARQACQTLNLSASQSASVCSNSTALKGVTSYSPVQHQKHKVLALCSNVSLSSASTAENKCLFFLKIRIWWFKGALCKIFLVKNI